MMVPSFALFSSVTIHRLRGLVQSGWRCSNMHGMTGLIILLLWSPIVLASDTETARANVLYHQLRCVVCSGQSLAESNAEMAEQMRHLVRKQLKEGMSNDEILQFFSERYGDEILTTPPFNPFTWVLWLAPILCVSIGLLVWRLSQKKTSP